MQTDNALIFIAKNKGLKTQADKLIEEMEELATEVAAFIYDTPPNFDHVAEEIADVEIMLEQVKYLLANHDSVERHRKFKINRQLERMIMHKE